MKRSRQRHAAKRRLRRAQKECRWRAVQQDIDTTATALAYAWYSGRLHEGP